MTHEEAHRLILTLRATHFDPTVVDAYLASAARFDRVRSRACRDLTHPKCMNLEKMARDYMTEQGYSRLAA